jgi:hypothetical protein
MEEEAKAVALPTPRKRCVSMKQLQRDPYVEPEHEDAADARAGIRQTDPDAHGDAQAPTHPCLLGAVLGAGAHMAHKTKKRERDSFISM